jgi:ABC-2 type transport system ATP-binding protein
MAEAQALADRVVLLSDGAVVAEGPPAQLGRTDGPGGAGGAGAEHTRITFTLPAGVALADLPVPGTSKEGSVVIETAQPVAALQRLTSWAVRHDVLLAGLTVDRPSLEDVYLRLTREEVPFGPQDRRP